MEKYYAFYEELRKIEKATGLYLADEGVDAENTPVKPDHADYWKLMLVAAEHAAGIRAEEAGKDINVLVGRIIY
jgi:hypothetical protein